MNHLLQLRLWSIESWHRHVIGAEFRSGSEVEFGPSYPPVTAFGRQTELNQVWISRVPSSPIGHWQSFCQGILNKRNGPDGLSSVKPLCWQRYTEILEQPRTTMKMNMKLSDWANVAEIVGAVAVIVTLAYVAVQIEQNTIAVEASTRQGRLDFGWQQTELLITQPGLVTLVMEAELNADDLDKDERLVFYEFTTWRMATWELTYQEYADGLIDEETWAAWNGYFMLMAEGKPGYKKFFRDTRQQWDSRFMVHVDKSLGIND